MPSGVPIHNRMDPEVLRRLYEDEGLSTLKIGQRFGFSASMIRRWLIADGVRIRTPEEDRKVKGHIMRKVIGVEYRPYDADPLTGEVFTTPIDLLECGHKKKRYFKKNGHLAAQTLTMRCRACERERDK